MIYFIQAANGRGPIKIGVSIRPEKRLVSIQLISPTRLKIIKTLKGGQDQELALHHHFAHLRLHGEWFEAAPELVDFINNTNEVVSFLMAVKPKHRITIEPVKTLEEVSDMNEARRISKIDALMEKAAIKSIDSPQYKRLMMAREMALAQSLENQNL